MSFEPSLVPWPPAEPPRRRTWRPSPERLIGAAVGIGVGMAFGALAIGASADRSTDLPGLLEGLLPPVVAGGVSGFAGGRRAWRVRSARGWLVVTLSVAIVALWSGAILAIGSLGPRGEPASALDVVAALASVVFFAPFAAAAATFLVGPTVLCAAIAWSIVMWRIRRVALGGAGLR